MLSFYDFSIVLFSLDAIKTVHKCDNKNTQNFLRAEFNKYLFKNFFAYSSPKVLKNFIIRKLIKYFKIEKIKKWKKNVFKAFIK